MTTGAAGSNMKPELTVGHYQLQCDECLATLTIPAQKSPAGGMVSLTFRKTAHEKQPKCSLCDYKMQTTLPQSTLPGPGQSLGVSKDANGKTRFPLFPPATTDAPAAAPDEIEPLD